MDTLLFSNKFYRILEKATDPDREKRYESISEFKEAWENGS